MSYDTDDTSMSEISLDYANGSNSSSSSSDSSDSDSESFRRGVDIWNTSSIDTVDNTRAFDRLYRSHYLSDVTFIVGKEEKRYVPAHKLVLSVCSWEFHNIFNLLELDNYVIPIEDVSYQGFLYFLKYCYTGPINFDDGQLKTDDIFDIYKLADRFDMKRLKVACTYILCKKVTCGTCLKWFVDWKFLDKDSIVRMNIVQSIAWHFIELTTKEKYIQSFYELPLESLREIAQLDNLRCDEMLLLDALVRWAKHQCAKKNVVFKPWKLRLILESVFYEIRFPTMTIEWFLEAQTKYPGILTPKEVFDITLFITKQTNSCPKFSTKERDFTIVNPRHLYIYGKTFVKTFKGVDVIIGNNRATHRMSIIIKCTAPRYLYGFAVITKRNTENKLITCNVWKAKRCVYKADSFEIERKILNYDCEFLVVYFKKPFLVGVMQKFNLSCTFHDTVLILQGLEVKPRVEKMNLLFEKSKHAVLPYLIFSKKSIKQK